MKYMSNCYGEVEIISQSGKDCVVRFSNTGFTRKANIDNVKAGKVKDTSVVYEPPTVELNKKMSSNNCGDFIVLTKKGKQCTLQFTATGFTRTANIDNVSVGKVRDPYAVTVYGKGYLGEYKKPHYWKQAGQLWRNMLKRCYSTKDTRGYYGTGVEVDKRWLSFANFVEDLPNLSNFSEWVRGQGSSSPKYNLDKDIKIPGNKVYSREACQFILDSENKSAGGIQRHRK